MVRFAVMRRIRSATPDYCDHATLLELAVLQGDRAAAARHLGNAVARLREPWEARISADNLETIRAARATRGPVEPWLNEVLEKLRAVQGGVGSGAIESTITA